MSEQKLRDDIAEFLDAVLMTEAWEESGEEAADRVLAIVRDAGWGPGDDPQAGNAD